MPMHLIHAQLTNLKESSIFTLKYPSTCRQMSVCANYETAFLAVNVLEPPIPIALMVRMMIKWYSCED